MKRHLLSLFGLISTIAISATQYMHVNQSDGKEYDVNIEKTDKVSHVKKDGEIFIKVERNNNSYSLYPIDGTEVTFDNEIARVDTNVNNWKISPTLIEGCEFDTTVLNTLRESNVSKRHIDEMRYELQEEYGICIEQKKGGAGLTYSQSEKEIHNAANKYAAKLFTKIANGSNFKDKNLIFSPTSFQFALAMLANGSDNNVYSTITTALGKENMPLEQLNTLYAKRIANLTSVNPLKVKIGVANAAFLQNNTRFGKNFLQDIEDYFKASLNNVDFSQDSTYKLIDNWANENTNGMIPSIGIPKDSLIMLVLANAISFQSEWVNQFYEGNTKPGKFTTSLGEEIEVDKMRKSLTNISEQKFLGDYAQASDFEMVSLPFYEGYVMDIILPNEGISAESVLTQLDFQKIEYKKLIEYNEEKTIVYLPIVSLPKFNIDAEINLNEPLIKNGLEDIFTSNYEKISELVKVDLIKQNTHLEIDEDGAKGAAVTVIVMVGEVGEPPVVDLEIKEINFDVNRPFIATVRHKENNELLFLGLINDPRLKE